MEKETFISICNHYKKLGDLQEKINYLLVFPNEETGFPPEYADGALYQIARNFLKEVFWHEAIKPIDTEEIEGML